MQSLLEHLRACLNIVSHASFVCCTWHVCRLNKPLAIEIDWATPVSRMKRSLIILSYSKSALACNENLAHGLSVTESNQDIFMFKTRITNFPWKLELLNECARVGCAQKLHQSILYASI